MLNNRLSARITTDLLPFNLLFLHVHCLIKVSHFHFILGYAMSIGGNLILEDLGIYREILDSKSFED